MCPLDTHGKSGNHFVHKHIPTDSIIYMSICKMLSVLVENLHYLVLMMKIHLYKKAKDTSSLFIFMQYSNFGYFFAFNFRFLTKNGQRAAKIATAKSIPPRMSVGKCT